VLATLLLAACGSRSGLPVPERTRDAGRDAGRDPGPDAAFDAGFDAGYDAGPPCRGDRECDDGIACTVDRCRVGGCVRTPDDAQCADDTFCNGEERCDPAAGCVTSVVVCDDGVDCTRDRCDERSRACFADPDPDLCPISHRCDPVTGCVVRALAHEAGQLYEVDLPGGETLAAGFSPYSLTDIALHPDGTLYGVAYDVIVQVELATGATVELSRLGVFELLNALDAAPDGTLYAAGSGLVYRIDRRTGAASNVAGLPPGTVSAGDIAFVSGRMLVTVAPAFDPMLGVSSLVEVDVAGGRSRNLGSIGFRCVWGLAAYGSQLYGFTCERQLISIDPLTGAGRLLTGTDVAYWGASAR
jgi:hypothetical protein